MQHGNVVDHTKRDVRLGDVALVGEVFEVGGGAEELWIRFHRNGVGGAGGVELFRCGRGGGGKE